MNGEQNRRNGTSEYTIQSEPINTNLDPELQRILIALRSGQKLDSMLREELIAGEVVVDVVAKLRDAHATVPGLVVVQKIGPIVSGSVVASQIEKVRMDKNVISLKAARQLRRMLSNSVPEIRASRQQILAKFSSIFDPGTFENVDGSGVIIGIVDNGCDLAHPHFQRVGGDTRILYLWDQRGGLTNDSPQGYGYGREFSAETINKALLANPTAPQEILGYELVRSSHGTRVMDIAAGGGSGDNPPGVAPKADIIFVDAALGYESESEESFGNSRHLLEAVKYIFDKAQHLNKHAVVNISLNYDCGPHDGSTPIEEGFDLLLEVPGRSIVIAAGNSRRQGHVRKTVHPRTVCMIGWQIHEYDHTTNKMALWYTGKRKLTLELISPRGQVLGPFPLNSAFTIYRNGERAAQVFHRFKDPGNCDNHIVLVFTTVMEEGVWRLVVSPAEKELFAPFDVHAWIETDGGGTASTFMETEIDESYTIGALSCGHSTIAVGSYDALNPTTLESVSAEGPTRDGRQKPEVSAPGLNVRAAIALTGSVGEDGGGTSNAAPHVTGLIALLMQDAPQPLTTNEIRTIVINSARRHPPSDASVWDPRYGRGRVDVVGALIERRRFVPSANNQLHRRETPVEKPVVLASKGERVDKLLREKMLVPTTLEWSTSAITPNTPRLRKSAPEELISSEVSKPPATKGHTSVKSKDHNLNNEAKLRSDDHFAARVQLSSERRESMSSEESKSVLFHDRPATGGVDHTPIIITDGSAAIEFTERLYIPVTGNPNRRRSTGLHLVKISVNQNHDPGVNPESIGRICVSLDAGELYEIEFLCTREGQPPKNFVVGGGPTVSPEIEFDHGAGGEYQKTANFPPIDLGQRFGNLQRNIARMQIFRIEGNSRVPIHDCGRATQGCEYRILDIH